MNFTRRDFLALASTGALATLAACSQRSDDTATSAQSATTEASTVDKEEFKALALDGAAWHYDSDNDVYWQIGLAYCTDPAAKTYEQLGVYVPGAYLTGKASGDTYTCTVNEDGQVGTYTASTAPVVMPINAGDFAAQAAPTSYSYDGLQSYLSQGLIYVYAGFRGRSSGYESSSDKFFSGGAPWAVADLKAAVRYLRYNAGALPGDLSRVFTFGHGGGGALSALMGSTGDSELYTPYLEEIGAATHDANGDGLSDVTFGSASWCPLTSLDTADAAYEWMMGQYSSDGTRAEGIWTKLLSDDLSSSYASYINSMDLRDAGGESLTLDETEGGIFTDGSYYDYLLGEVQDSINNFLADTQFPYTPSYTSVSDGSFPGDGNLKASESAAVAEVATSAASSTSTVATTTAAASGQHALVTYATIEDYIASLNASGQWVTYNERKGTARITSLGAFVTTCRPASKDVCAFDSTTRNQPANQLFGNDDSSSLHFDQTIADLLGSRQDVYAAASGWDAGYVQAWADDIAKTDSLGTDMPTRQGMYNPLYFLSGHYAGYGTAQVAPHWRINSGIDQTDTSLTVESNLALALSHYDGVKDVSFSAVWGQGHTLAERTGSAVDNFVSWVGTCCAQ